MMRQTILDLVALGPLPSEDDAEQEQLNRYKALLHAIERPVSDDEAERWSGCSVLMTATGWLGTL